MQADPVDYGEWKTGIQASGTLSSINGFLGKVAQAIAGGLSGYYLQLVDMSMAQPSKVRKPLYPLMQCIYISQLSIDMFHDYDAFLYLG